MTQLFEQLQTALATRYLLERELGRGGMATVYLARDLKHDRQVALKVMHPELAMMLGPERFLAEIRLTAALNHPNILPLYDSGEAGGQLYFVMPFVPGESLRARLERERQLPIDAALRITREVGAALAHAHGLGIIHRDIKPENILLSGGQAVVADFGIARAVAAGETSRLTQAGSAIGTPAYMAPEQATGERHIDARCDVYALGCVLYELLTGSPPFTGATVQAITARKLSEPVPKVRIVRERVPPAIEAAIERALASVPADRFESSQAFLDALERPTPDAAPARHRLRGRSLRILTSVGGALLVIAMVWWAQSSRARSASPDALAPAKRLAVLPLENRGADSTEDYVADGLTDALIAALAQVRALQVISRSSVTEFKGSRAPAPEIARKLRVQALLQGSVLRAGGNVEVVLNLVDGATGDTLWSDRFAREFHDLPRLSGEVAQRVAREVDARLTHDERQRVTAARPVDAVAEESYLRGRFQLNTRTAEGIQASVDHFRQALAADPAFAPAQAGLAEYYNLLPFYTNVPPSEAFSNARTAAEKAIELDPNLPEAHAALAYVLAYGHWDWAGAEQEYRRALELSPSGADAHHAYSRLLAAIGRVGEAVAQVRQAYDLDPLNLVARANVGVILYFARDYPGAQAQLEATLGLDPEFSTAHWGLGLVYEQLRRFDEAFRQFERAMAIAGRGTNSLASLGHAYAAAGRPKEAQAILPELLARTTSGRSISYQVAIVYAGLNEVDEAFRWLEKAFEERSPLLSYMKMDPRLEGLRGDPRYGALLTRMHFPAER